VKSPNVSSHVGQCTDRQTETQRETQTYTQTDIRYYEAPR